MKFDKSVLPEQFVSVVKFTETTFRAYDSMMKAGELKTVKQFISELTTIREACSDLLDHSRNARDGSKLVQAQVTKLRTKITAVATGLREGQFKSITETRQVLSQTIRPLLDSYLKRARELHLDANVPSAFVREWGHEMTPATKSLLAVVTRDPETFKPKKEETVFANFDKFETKLPSSLNGRMYTTTSAPVIAYNAIISPKTLRTAGIAYERINELGSYVLLNQVLIAFDVRKALEANDATPVGVKNNKSGTLKARKATERNKQVQENFVIELLDKINARGTQAFSLMSNTFPRHHHNPNIAFAWIAPRHAYQSFVRSNAVNLPWGFPWTQRQSDHV